VEITKPAVHKNVHVYFYNNFGKYEPVIAIVSLLHFEMNYRTSCSKICHLSSYLLHFCCKYV